MADDEWSYEASVDRMDVDLTAEQWLRATWEGGPAVVRLFLTLGWKYGLGLRLGSTSDTTRVLGWHIVDSVPHCVTVAADSRLLRAENVLTVDDGRLTWRTVVVPKNTAGRVMWTLASIIHRWLVPRSVRRAIRRHGEA
jgi:Protein of unknown function (DUF2867)